MSRAEALDLLARSEPLLAARYGVARRALFGSMGRDAARDDGDRDDVFAAFGVPATSAR